jgi:hypothetical protein
VTPDDGFTTAGDELAAVQAIDGAKLSAAHFATDHSYSDCRIALQMCVRDWLQHHYPDTGGQVVNQMLDTARDSASREGLTTDKPIGEVVAALKSGEMIGSVKQVAADVLEAGKSAAKPEPASQQPTDQFGQA